MAEVAAWEVEGSAAAFAGACTGTGAGLTPEGPVAYRGQPGHGACNAERRLGGEQLVLLLAERDLVREGGNGHAQGFALRRVEHMQERLDEYQQRGGRMYHTAETPQGYRHSALGLG